MGLSDDTLINVEILGLYDSAGRFEFTDGITIDIEGDSDGLLTDNNFFAILLLNPVGDVQSGETGCEHCLFGLLLQTAPGSQHKDSSLQVCA